MLERGEKLARLLETSARENPGPAADAAVARVRGLLDEGRALAAAPDDDAAREGRARVSAALLALMHGV